MDKDIFKKLTNLFHNSKDDWQHIYDDDDEINALYDDEDSMFIAYTVNTSNIRR